MFFQRSHPPEYHANEGRGGRVWGHAISTDGMVTWQRQPLSGVWGSSGGGVALPTGHRVGNETWHAAVMSSAVSAQPCGHTVWYSTDPHLGASSFRPYGNGTCEGATTSNRSGVICSKMVPETARSGFIGDNYLWREVDNSGSSTYYALVGGNKCPEGSPPWCGDMLPAATPQALLFRSDSLTQWEFVSVLWDGEGKVTASKIGNRFDTPDFFRLRDGRYALLYLVNGRTIWMIGRLDRSSFQYVVERQGVVDMGDGSFHCSQSFWDPSQRRILFGWIRLVVPGQNWSGAQTIPRQIELSSDGERLIFRPLVGLDSLHAHSTVVPQTNLLPGERLVLTEMFQTALQLHVRIEVSLPVAADDGSSLTFTIDVLGGQDLNGTSIFLSTVPTSTSGIANSNCLASGIVSNRSTTGTPISDVPITLPDTPAGMSAATACQALCCQTDGCASWTAMTSNASSVCWLRYAGEKTNDFTGCPNKAADCWSGVWTGEDLPLNLRLESKHHTSHDGTESMQLIHSERRLRSTSLSTDRILSAVLDVFIDGAVLEVYANGGERVLTATSAYATQTGLTLRALGSSAVAGTDASTANFTAQVWEMKPAIFGNESGRPAKKKKSPPFMHGCINETARALPYCNNTNLSIEERLDDLTGQLTLLEKMRILKAHGSGKTASEDQLAYPRGKLIQRIGLPAYAWDRDSDDLHGYSYDCLNSSKKSCPTTFPASPTMGCSFNASLISVMGDVVSTEQRAITSNPDEVAAMCKTWKVTYPNTTRAACPFDTGVNLWGPTLNIDRDP
jgi:sucrose-6-phosphate hydrolase SacC (GH32 family)